MTVDEFLTRLNKPRYVYMMAKPQAAHNKSARTRLEKSEKEIHDLIMEYEFSQEVLEAVHSDH